MDQESTNRARLVARIAEHEAKAGRPVNAGAIAADVEALGKCGRSLGRIVERQCNGYHDGEQEKRDLRLEERKVSEARAIAERYGMTIRTQGDPRGYALRVRAPWLDGNTWGGSRAGDDYGIA